MIRYLLPAGFWLLTGCGASSLDAGTDPATSVSTRLAAMVDGEVPGIQYVVVDRNGVVFEAAMGRRDVASPAPMQRETLQMSYSMTKVITALAVLKLVDEGKM